MAPPTRHDPLPLILVVLTVTTGLVDAVSVLGLGRIFTANMTGNVVFLGGNFTEVREDGGAGRRPAGGWRRPPN